MYQNKEQLASKLYEIIDDLTLEGAEAPISINKLLTPAQRYSLIMTLVRQLPKTDIQYVQHFNRMFNLEKDDTHIIADSKHKELQFSLMLSAMFKYAYSTGINTVTAYDIFVKVMANVKKQIPESTLTNTLNSLLDVLYTTFTAIDLHNLSDIYHIGMEEVYKSNISKLIPVTEKVEEDLTHSIAPLSINGRTVYTKDLKNGFVAIIDSRTGEILRPSSYTPPNLIPIIYKHLNTKTNG